MKDRFVIDSNILIYGLNKNAGEKHLKARKFVFKARNREAGIPAQCLAETYFQVLKKNLSPVRAKNAIESLKHDREFEILGYNSKELDKALGVEENFWDRMIEETALSNGYDVIYTENTEDFEDIEAINPLE